MSITENDLNTLYSILEQVTKESPSSITRICRAMNAYGYTPFSIRKTIYALSHLPYFQFLVDGKPLVNFSDSDLEDYENGKYDNNTLTVRTYGGLILLNTREKKTVNKILSEHRRGYDEANEYIFAGEITREIYHYPNYSMLEDIHNALKENKTYQCKTTNGKTVSPLGIYYSPLKGEYYGYVINGEYMDFIPFPDLSLSTINGQKKTHRITEKEKKIIERILPYLWESEKVPIDCQPQHCILIVGNEKNTQKKVLFELSSHTQNKKIDVQTSLRKNGEMEIHLTLIPSDSFLSWILSYGSSVLAIKPDNLREKIIQTYRNILE